MHKHIAPTRKEDGCYTDLQKTLDGVDREDVLLLLGDLPRVGSIEKHTGIGMGVRSCHGVGKMDENGEALLSFCALNELVFMTTIFEKKNIHEYTWQHPCKGSKKWHHQAQMLLFCAQRIALTGSGRIKHLMKAHALISATSCLTSG